MFDKLTRPMVPCIVLAVPSSRGKGVLVSPTIYGNVMVGPTSENLDGRTATGTSEDGFEFLVSKGRALMPSLFDEGITATYAGLRGQAPTVDCDTVVFTGVGWTPCRRRGDRLVGASQRATQGRPHPHRWTLQMGCPQLVSPEGGVATRGDLLFRVDEYRRLPKLRAQQAASRTYSAGIPFRGN